MPGSKGMTNPRWSSSDDINRALRRRWDSGELLRRMAADTAWEPIGITLRGPTARQLGADLPAVQAWVAQLRQASASGSRFRLTTRRVGGRLVGSNELPAVAWFDSPDQAWSLLKVRADVTAYRALMQQTTQAEPSLLDWVARHPHRALAHAAEWDRVLRTVRWLHRRAGTAAYLRQVDVPGVDTKFIERREALLVELLDAMTGVPDGEGGRRGALQARYGFLGRPDRIRVRSLDGAALLPGGPLTDITVRVEELARMPLPAGPVLVVENEVTFLALPPVPGGVAFFGAGFDVLRLHRLTWLQGRRITYWGDIDTHGFVILDRLRQTLPQVESLLMDEQTLHSHQQQWVTEPSPSREQLTRLTDAEQEVYADLVGDVHGPAVRLEQERVGYAWVRQALVTARLG